MKWQVSQDIIVVKGNPLFNIVALAGRGSRCQRRVVYKGGPGGRGRVTESEPQRAWSAERKRRSHPAKYSQAMKMQGP